MGERPKGARSQARAEGRASRMMEALRAADRLDTAETAWAKAREAYREAVVALYRMDGLSQAEVGDLVGRSQSSISAALRR